MDLDGEVDALRRSLNEVRDELVRGTVDARVLAELGQAVAGDAGRLVRAVRQAPDRRRLLEPCIDAWAQLKQAMDEADEVEGAAAALDLEQEAMDLYGLIGRLEVAFLLTGLPVRRAAADTGLAQGYISDLCRANKGLPSAEAAGRLDAFLVKADASSGSRSVTAVVERTAGTIDALRLARRQRRAQGAPRSLPSGSTRDDLRVQAVSEAARRDKAFLNLAERLLTLGDRERRAVTRLVEDLAES